MEDDTRARFGTLEGWIDALRSAEGFYPGAEGFRIGSTRLFEKLVSAAEHDDEYHLYQRDDDGAESDLTGARSIQGIPVSETAPTTTQILGYNALTNEWTPTAAGAAAAHKDSHDPNNGADPLDTANAAAITGVVGAGTGSSHSFARADHIHAISHSILNNRLATIDGTTNAPANLDYAKWTTLGLEGKTYAQLRADINVADGADVTGDNTPKAHGPAQHTEGNAWKMTYHDAAGDETEIAVGADGTVLTGQGTSAAPAFQAASEHAHANDHAQAHGPSDHTGFANWKVIYTDASGDQQEVAVGGDGTVFTGTGTSSAPAFQAASEHAHANDHAESHNIASHNDTTGTGAELEELTDGSETTLHSHAGGNGGGDVTHQAILPITDELALNAEGPHVPIVFAPKADSGDEIYIRSKTNMTATITVYCYNQAGAQQWSQAVAMAGVKYNSVGSLSHDIDENDYLMAKITAYTSGGDEPLAVVRFKETAV